MSLTPEQLNPIRAFLRENSHFRRSVSELRTHPFQFPDVPGKYDTLSEASATKPSKGVLVSLALAGGLLIASGFVWRVIQFRSAKSPKSIFPLAQLDRDQLIPSLVKWTPKDLAQQLSHLAPVLCVVLGFVLLLLAALFLVVRTPKHRADPLLSRLLQRKLRSQTALSNAFVHSLLSNPRFEKIFERAVGTVFPIDSVYERSTADWDNFNERLLETLLRYEPFVHFAVNHQGMEGLDSYQRILREHFKYGVRQMLYGEVLNDLDCAFLYRNATDPWKRFFDWTSTLDLKKIGDLFPKAEKSSGGIDKKTVAVYTVAAIILFAVLPKPDARKAKGKPQDTGCVTCRSTPLPSEIHLAVDAHQFAEELTAKSCQQCSRRAAPLFPSTINISEPNKPAPLINIASPSVPSTTNLEVTYKLEPPPINTTPPKVPDRNAILIKFVRSKTPKFNAPDFYIHLSAEVVCKYNATLIDAQERHPYSSEMDVSQDKSNSDACPLYGGNVGIVAVPFSREPFYNNDLKAYVTLVDKHSNWLGKTNEVTVLINYP